MTITIKPFTGEELPIKIDRLYWQKYYDAETVQRSNELRQEFTIYSTDAAIHFDLYEQANKNAPVLIFNHGGGGYSRLFVLLALKLYERGYTLILLNQRGQGYSEGDRNDFTLNQCIQNIVDVTKWARLYYSGRLFLGGASVGSGLVYNAAAAGAPVDALICHNLYDFGRADNALALSRVAWLLNVPGMAGLSGFFTTLAAKAYPTFKVPFNLIGKFEGMVDQRDPGFYQLWRNDPLPVRKVTLRYLQSTFNTPPAIPLEQDRLPVLVINPMRDLMVKPAVTRRNYERLGGLKQYIEISYGHWATGPQFIAEYVQILDNYMQAQMQG